MQALALGSNSFCYIMSIWGERNNRIVRSISPSIGALLEVVSLRVAKWVLIRKELNHVKLNDIFYSGKACKGHGLRKERKLEAGTILLSGKDFKGYGLQKWMKVEAGTTPGALMWMER
eukprot:TRINITY_DN19126_c1_g3_i2.p1 TRINITY_DN19126_c1_g3~~TRINITY_DN19126_c1_g3_i2.p1  ORF type:complete len:118 (+),score=28.00 TRINITY_DN19126_c1_g3_i2:694-1047(+)